MFMVRSLAIVVVKAEFPVFPLEAMEWPRALLANPIPGTIFRMSFIWFILIFIILIVMSAAVYNPSTHITNLIKGRKYELKSFINYHHVPNVD